jgi:tetratricopeptide (TPR) repeat protein
MAYVTLPRPYWNAQRIVVAAVLAVFVVVFGAVVLSAWPVAEEAPAKAPVVVTVAPPPVKAEPFDITINASELQPPSEVQGLADVVEDIPSIVVHPLGTGHAHALAPVLEVTIEDVDVVQERAAAQARKAHNFAKAADLKKALRYQHKAVERDPENMTYRLELAILYDSLGDKKNAALLYQQVAQAFANDDDTLPVKMDIKVIQARLDYLRAMDSQ